ncbi:MAG: hypothetical protein ACMUHY_01800 [Thermoplasmatota archaeon]
MKIKEERTLMAYGDDIRTRSWKDWIRAHTSLAKPVHRYEGEIRLYPDRIEFRGIDSRKDREYFKVVKKEDVTGIHHGFDRTFGKREDRSLGLGFKPLRITFFDDGTERTMYLITSFDRLRRSSNNPAWYRSLTEWIST